MCELKKKKSLRMLHRQRFSFFSKNVSPFIVTTKKEDVQVELGQLRVVQLVFICRVELQF